MQHRIADPELAAATLATQTVRSVRLQLQALRHDPPDDVRQLKRSRWKKPLEEMRLRHSLAGVPLTWREPYWPQKEAPPAPITLRPGPQALEWELQCCIGSGALPGDSIAGAGYHNKVDTCLGNTSSLAIPATRPTAIQPGNPQPA